MVHTLIPMRTAIEIYLRQTHYFHMYYWSYIAEGNALTADMLMQGIQYCRVHSPVEIMAMIRMLGEIVKSQPKVASS
jgi:hypothetical protein